jgi:hypothetical protein
VRADALPPGRLRWGVGSAGWGLLAADARLPQPLDGEAHRRLRGLVLDLLETLASRRLSDVPTLAVDDRFGQDAPVDAGELLAACVRHRVPEVHFSGRVTVLDGPAIRRLEGALRVRRGAAVSALAPLGDRAVARFLRYRPDRPLDILETRILGAVSDGPSLEQLFERFGREAAPSEVLARARALERDRVVELILPVDDPTAGAGGSNLYRTGD